MHRVGRYTQISQGTKKTTFSLKVKMGKYKNCTSTGINTNGGIIKTA